MTNVETFPVKRAAAAETPAPRIPHCAVRALERYGISLSIYDVIDLAKRCCEGEGLLETKTDGSTYHALIYGDRVLWLVYRSPRNGSRRLFGTVITIMPPTIGHARGRRDFQFKRRRQISRGMWR